MSGEVHAAHHVPQKVTQTPRRGGNGRTGRDAYDLATVLAIAVAAFNEHGYEATSMGILAERLGTSRSAIYYHVTSKEDLLRLALDRALDGLEGVLLEPGATVGPADQRLRHVLRRAVEVLVEELPFVTLLLRLRGNTEVERSALDRRRRFDHAVTKLIDAARDQGAVRTDVDAGTTTRLLFGMINSIVDWYRPGGALSTSQLADDVIAVALSGISRQEIRRPGA
ncbi:MAG TPA: TetR/AcrR family transcriptional regulator [Pseudolysinimonas sp.]|jgi:AcrR family transcriptional regulator